jgi:uncharacterized protein (DUF2164 family)
VQKTSGYGRDAEREYPMEMTILESSNPHEEESRRWFHGIQSKGRIEPHVVEQNRTQEILEHVTARLGEVHYNQGGRAERGGNIESSLFRLPIQE